MDLLFFFSILMNILFGIVIILFILMKYRRWKFSKQDFPQEDDAPNCPLCDSSNTTKIRYGHVPASKLKDYMKKLKADGRIYGGDIVHERSRAYFCRNCGKRFHSQHEWWLKEYGQQ